MNYPVRCQVVSVDGDQWRRTPDESRPHIGKLGTAYQDDPLTVRIVLDDGGVIYGYECWWTPLEEHDEKVSASLRTSDDARAARRDPAGG